MEQKIINGFVIKKLPERWVFEWEANNPSTGYGDKFHSEAAAIAWAEKKRDVYQGKFAVTDAAGDYVFYSNSRADAEQERDNIDSTIAEESGEGSAAVMVWNNREQGYILEG